MEQNPVQQKNLKQKQNPSVIDWLLIYTGAIILMNLLIRTQIYPVSYTHLTLPTMAVV